MTKEEAILARHSVREYTGSALTEAEVNALRTLIDETNKASGLHIQLVTNESRAFSGMASYGKFKGVSNYVVMAGRKSADLEEKTGYYGEQIVLAAQTMGLNTCWVGMTYKKVKESYTLSEDEKVVCLIAIGHGATQGKAHKTKTPEAVSNATADSPEWFKKGVAAALLAPTALNQQKFRIELTNVGEGGLPTVSAQRRFSMAGYTRIDLGIVKCHFEIGAGKENFAWKDEA